MIKRALRFRHLPAGSIYPRDQQEASNRLRVHFATRVSLRTRRRPDLPISPPSALPMPLPCSPCGLQAGTSSWGSLGTRTPPAECSILCLAVRVANVGNRTRTPSSPLVHTCFAPYPAPRMCTALTSQPSCLATGPRLPPSSRSPAPLTSRPPSPLPPRPRRRPRGPRRPGLPNKRAVGWWRGPQRERQRRQLRATPPCMRERHAAAAEAGATGRTGQRRRRRAGQHVSTCTCAALRCYVMLCHVRCGEGGDGGVIPHPPELVVASKLFIYT